MGFENREIAVGNLEVITIILIGLISIPVLWMIGGVKKITKKRELKVKDKLFIEMFNRGSPKKTDGNQIPARTYGTE